MIEHPIAGNASHVPPVPCDPRNPMDKFSLWRRLEPMELPVPRFKVFNSFVIHNLLANAHLNRDKIESNLSVPGFQGRHKNALI